MKTRLLNGLPSEILNEIQGYLDQTAEEIAQKYDLIHSRREALGISLAVITEKALHVVQEKPVDDHRQHRFRDASCPYCNKKGHTEKVCFSKCDDEKLTKMSEKISAVMAGMITASNNEAFESILNKIKRMNLKG